MNAYRGIFVGNRLIDFIVDPIEIFAVVVNALTTVKRLRQTVLGLNRVTRHSKVSMIRVQRRYTFRSTRIRGRIFKSSDRSVFHRWLIDELRGFSKKIPTLNVSLL